MRITLSARQLGRSHAVTLSTGVVLYLNVPMMRLYEEFLRHSSILVKVYLSGCVPVLFWLRNDEKHLFPLYIFQSILMIVLTVTLPS